MHFQSALISEHVAGNHQTSLDVSSWKVQGCLWLPSWYGRWGRTIHLWGTESRQLWRSCRSGGISKQQWYSSV